MRRDSKLVTFATLALGLLGLGAAPEAQAQTLPAIASAPANAPPAVPPGMKVACMQSGTVLTAAANCPVLKWNGYTYWAFSYMDNRVSLGIVAYDAAGKVAAQWEKPGTRYVYAITTDPVASTVTFAGQSDAKISLKWSDLVPPVALPATPRWEKVAAPVGGTLKQISVGGANAVWGLDTGGFPWKWNGSAWEKKAGTVSTLSVTADGTVWATNPPDSMRVLKLDVANNKWTWNLPTGMKQLAAVNATTAFGLDNGGSHFKLNGAAWEKLGCCVSQISAGADGELWATNPPDSNRVLRWDGTKWTWPMPTGMIFVSVGNAKNIWALNGSDQVFKWSGSAWAPMPGALHNISAAGDGSVWGIDAQGAAYKWIP